MFFLCRIRPDPPRVFLVFTERGSVFPSPSCISLTLKSLVLHRWWWWWWGGWWWWWRGGWRWRVVVRLLLGFPSFLLCFCCNLRCSPKTTTSMCRCIRSSALYVFYIFIRWRGERIVKVFGFLLCHSTIALATLIIPAFTSGAWRNPVRLASRCFWWRKWEYK